MTAMGKLREARQHWQWPPPKSHPCDSAAHASRILVGDSLCPKKVGFVQKITIDHIAWLIM
jgi:hypothetical protein